MVRLLLSEEQAEVLSEAISDWLNWESISFIPDPRKSALEEVGESIERQLSQQP